MDRRTLLAIILCFGIWLGWQKLYLEPRMPKQTAPQTVATATGSAQAPTTTTPSSGTGAGAATMQPAAPAQPRPSQTVALKSSTGEFTVTDGAKFFGDWTLKAYKINLKKDASPVDMASVINQKGAVDFAVDDPEFAYINAVQGTLTKTAQGALWSYEDANIKLTREFIANENSPAVEVKIQADFKTKRPRFAFLSLAHGKLAKDPEEQDRVLLYWSNKTLERVLVNDASEIKDVPTAVKYIGASSRYFLLSIVNQEGSPEPKGLVQPVGADAARISLVYPITDNALRLKTRMFFGPKELSTLRAVDPALDNTVDFGWFTIFAYPLLKLLRWFYQFVGNYGIAIIMLTLLLKVVTYPLTYKSMKSMKEMAKIQPELQRVREKYKDDREALNREMMSLMRTHGYNPMAGCLPILIQMPIFFALYRVLYSSIELYQAPFFGWIHDLSAHDPFYVTPVLLTLTMYIQQKLTPTTATDPAQQKMMQFMPIMFGAFMLALPSGLTVYMLVNAIAGIAQQIVLNKKFDTGHANAVTARAR